MGQRQAVEPMMRVPSLRSFASNFGWEEVDSVVLLPGGLGAASVLCELTWGKEKFAAIRSPLGLSPSTPARFLPLPLRAVHSGESCSTSSPPLPLLTLA